MKIPVYAPGRKPGAMWQMRTVFGASDTPSKRRITSESLKLYDGLHAKQAVGFFVATVLLIDKGIQI